MIEDVYRFEQKALRPIRQLSCYPARVCGVGLQMSQRWRVPMSLMCVWLLGNCCIVVRHHPVQEDLPSFYTPRGGRDKKLKKGRAMRKY
jgi:hypothetical protein